jgi:hypothetical protein
MLIMTVPLAGFMVFGKEFYSLWQPTLSADKINMVQLLSVIACFLCLFISMTQCCIMVFSVVNKLKIPVLVNIGIGVASVLMVILVLAFGNLGDKGVYIIAGVRIIQPMFAESSRDGSHPFFKFINHGFCKIDSSVPLSINEIDLSENQDYYENASGAQYPAHECKVGIVEIPLMTPRTEVGEDIGTPAIFTNKAYIWGKYLIMTPYISYRKRVITNILDTRLIDKPKGTYQETWAATQALSQLPTRFVIDNVNTEIYLHASYCAFGFNEFEVEQAKGFTCKIYDVHENLIFDGTDKGDGLYKLNVYKDADICKDRAGSKGLLSLDFMGHYWQITKEVTVNDVLNALPVW